MTNTATDRHDNNQPGTSNMYRSNPQSPYFNNRTRNQQQQQQLPQENKQEQIYEQQPQRNPFLQDITPQLETPPMEQEVQNKNTRIAIEQDRVQQSYSETYGETRSNQKSNADVNSYNRDVYGELNSRPSKAPAGMNERLLIERRTPDAYGRSNTMAAYNKQKVGDYEDVYGTYATENEYGKTYAKSPTTTQSNHQQSQDFSSAYVSLTCT